MSHTARTVRLVGVLIVALVLVPLMGCAAKPLYTVSCGADKPYTDNDGRQWLADRVLTEDAAWGAVGGDVVVRDPAEVSGTPCPQVYLTERYSMSAYKFKLKPGTYTVRLHFAETYSGIKAAGQRVFDVRLNGKVALKGLDVLKEAGGAFKPLVKEFKGVGVADKGLTIGFRENVQNPEINGIEVLAE